MRMSYRPGQWNAIVGTTAIVVLPPQTDADLIAEACVAKPVRIATRLGIAGQVLHALVPRVAQIAMNTSFRMFPDSDAAKGEKGGKPQLSPEGPVSVVVSAADRRAVVLRNGVEIGFESAPATAVAQCAQLCFGRLGGGLHLVGKTNRPTGGGNDLLTGHAGVQRSDHELMAAGR